MITMEETVACAAIRLESGLIVAGKRHHDCLGMILAQSVISKFDIESQGFMTTAGRYVGRAEGQLLQRKAGIASADSGGYRGQDLYSEDLY